MTNSIRYLDDGTTNVNGITVNTPYENDKDQVSIESFLQLMIAQITNQDFFSGDSGGSNSTTTDYITQLAQISLMQQMQELAYYQKTNYAMSMVGKEVTVASLGLGAKVNTDVGIVEKVTLTNNEYLVYVNGKGYELNQIQNVRNPSNTTSDSPLADLEKSAIIPMDVAEEYITFRWNPPSGLSEKELEDVTYSVYYSENAAMDTQALVEANGMRTATLGSDDGNQVTITGLEPGKTYFVNIVAKTKDGYSNVYEMMTVSTVKKV